MFKGLLSVLVLASLLVAEPSLTRTQVHMATFVKITLPKSQENFFSPAFDIIKMMDETFSTYKTQAQAFKLNHSKKLKVSHDFIELLYLSRELYKQTEGYFSIAIGSITKDLYHFGESTARIPQAKELVQAQSDSLGFSIKNHLVTLNAGVSIDFGGVAKGYTVDKVKDFLKKHKLKSFQIALSGDIYCEGPCTVAIQSPFEKDKLLKVLDLNNQAISTSGNYERYIKSKQFNHLIDPKKKRSQKNIASMTLYSSIYSNSTLDALATALSVMPHHTRMKTLKKYPKLSYVFITTQNKLYHYEYKEKKAL